MIRRAALVSVAALVCAACAGGGDENEPSAGGGRYLVYTKALGLPNQAIWIGDFEGRRMRRLTRGDYGLVSPDGTMIAVARGSRIYTVGSGGNGERLVGPGKPAVWLPDSRHLLALRRGALVNVDVENRSAIVLDSRGAVTWSLSPDARSVAYEVVERESRTGLCNPTTNLFIAGIDGSPKRRLTSDGRSAKPVWGEDWIAFASHPRGTCFKPRIWKIRPDGTGRRAVMRTLPRRFAWNGYYGVRPFAWVRGSGLLLATVATEWGGELLLVDDRTGRARKVDRDPRERFRVAVYPDDASRDGRHTVGAACGAEGPCTIHIFSVLDRRHRDVITANVAYPDWNR